MKLKTRLKVSKTSITECLSNEKITYQVEINQNNVMIM